MVEAVGESRCELLAGRARSAFSGEPGTEGGAPEVFAELTSE